MITTKVIEVSPTELADLINEGLKIHVENLFKQFSNQQPKGKEFLSRSETKDFFGVSYVTLHSWRNSGLITSYKMGNKTFFKREELVQRLLDSNRQAS